MRDRTADLLHAMQALSQLSYSPVVHRWGASYRVIYSCQAPAAALYILHDGGVGWLGFRRFHLAPAGFR